jgi:hypothetical protein
LNQSISVWSIAQLENPLKQNRLIMLRLIANRLGATQKVRSIVAHTTSLTQMLNPRAMNPLRWGYIRRQMYYVE